MRNHLSSFDRAAVICSVECCSRKVEALGLCSRHYRHQWRRLGPLSGRTPQGKPLAFLREHVIEYKGEDCLIWPFARGADGHGRVYFDGKTRRVSRLVCETLYGGSPTSKHEAAHSCGNGNAGCVAPLHLRWASRAENEADKIKHGMANRGERSNFAKLTKTDVMAIRALSGKMSQQKIADQFGIHQTTVCNILNGKIWGWASNREARAI